MHIQQDSISNLKILLVEDDPDTRSTIRMMLSEIGVTQVYDSTDGQKGLDFMEAASDMVNMVICDWNMPEVSGVDVLKHLRERHPQIPFLMVTGRSDIESVSEAKKCGVTAYIRKPFSFQELTEKIKIINFKSNKEN